MKTIYFAAAGDVHGDHAGLIERLAEVGARVAEPLTFVLQVGDFEPTRHEADLATMAGPDRRRLLGSFHQVLSGLLRYPAEVHFIGGNHEPYGWLGEWGEGGEIAPGIHFLGRAGVVERAGLRIAGLSGIHSPTRYAQPLPSDWLARGKPKEPTYFRQGDVEWLLEVGSVDILLTHDWPHGVMGPFGNAPARRLLDALRPRLHLVGHMHFPTQRRVSHPDGSVTTVIALNHVGHGKGDVRLFAWDGHQIEEVA